ncbi:MAG: fumarylacetoacetate hydrolase family protein [Candidatus Rokubacteria bacterium]|nr:fumarylacetoacetate hydrolase family protein [Candidatus Rokubacteria bacterium]
MPESIPASLIVETLRDTFREAWAALAAEVTERPRHDHLGWVLKVTIPAQPDVGYRSPNALVPTGADIVIPRDSTGPVEFEGELVAVVGRRAKHLAEDEALGCLLGYTLGNDVSERAWQQSDRTLWRAKNTDTFKPMGLVNETDLAPMAQRIRVRRDLVRVRWADGARAPAGRRGGGRERRDRRPAQPRRPRGLTRVTPSPGRRHRGPGRRRAGSARGSG